MTPRTSALHLRTRASGRDELLLVCDSERRCETKLPDERELVPTG